MQKRSRQEAVLQIIHAEKVSRQDQLVKLLDERGFEVTQASVSRDLVELGVVKVRGFYASPRSSDLSGFGIINLAIAGDNLIVAKCQSGLASAIAVKIDAANLKEVVGTIAGDDTIFIAVENAAIQRSAMKRLWEILSR